MPIPLQLSYNSCDTNAPIVDAPVVELQQKRFPLCPSHLLIPFFGGHKKLPFLGREEKNTYLISGGLFGKSGGKCNVAVKMPPSYLHHKDIECVSPKRVRFCVPASGILRASVGDIVLPLFNVLFVSCYRFSFFIFNKIKNKFPFAK